MTFRFPAPPGGALTPEMLAAYHEHGFLVLKGFATPEECLQLRRRAVSLMSAAASESRTVFSTTGRDHNADRYFMESGDKVRFFWEKDGFAEDGSLRGDPELCLNKIGHALHDQDPVFEAFSYRPEVGAMARRLGHRRPGIIQSIYILKPPRIGGEVTCHQDSTYIYTEPDTCLGFWLAVEEATVQNGCMWFLPGEHRGPLKERNVRVGGYATELRVLDDSPWPLERAIPIEAPVGAAVLFHGRAPHFSRANRSERSRHAYTLHLVDLEAEYPAENWLQRGGVREMPGREVLGAIGVDQV